LELKEMSSFTQHLFRFGITEIARSMKSDEVLLANKVHDSVGLFFSDTIGEFVGEVHDQRQEEAEEAGEVYGSKLERKFLNPWLYADVTLFADRPEVIRTVDTDARINEMLRGTVKSWDELINRIQWKNLKRLTSKIASSRTKESVQKESAQDVVSRATEDPDFLKFRLALT